MNKKSSIRQFENFVTSRRLLALAPIAISMAIVCASSPSHADPFGIPGVITMDSDGTITVGNDDNGGSVGTNGTTVTIDGNSVRVDTGGLSGNPQIETSGPQTGNYSTPRVGVGLPTSQVNTGQIGEVLAPTIFIPLSTGAKIIQNNEQSIRNFLNQLKNDIEQTLERNRQTFTQLSRLQGCLFTACYSEQRLKDKNRKAEEENEARAQKAKERAAEAFRNGETEKYKKRLNDELDALEKELNALKNEIHAIEDRNSKDARLVPALTAVIDEKRALQAINQWEPTRLGPWNSAVERFRSAIRNMNQYDSQGFKESLASFSEELVEISEQQGIEIGVLAAEALQALDIDSLVRMSGSISASLDLGRRELHTKENLKSDTEEEIKRVNEEIENADE